MHHISPARFFTVIGKFFIAATPRLHTFSLRFSVAVIALPLYAAAPVFAMGRDRPAGVPPSALIPWGEPVVWGREYLGEVSVPTLFTPLTGIARLTGDDCLISLRPAEGDDLWVRSSFWEGEKRARAGALRGENFYLGRRAHNRFFRLQTLPGKIPVSLSLTDYEPGFSGGRIKTRGSVQRSCGVRFDWGEHARTSERKHRGDNRPAPK